MFCCTLRSERKSLVFIVIVAHLGLGWEAKDGCPRRPPHGDLVGVGWAGDGGGGKRQGWPGWSEVVSRGGTEESRVLMQCSAMQCRAMQGSTEQCRAAQQGVPEKEIGGKRFWRGRDNKWRKICVGGERHDTTTTRLRAAADGNQTAEGPVQRTETRDSRTEQDRTCASSPLLAINAHWETNRTMTDALSRR